MREPITVYSSNGELSVHALSGRVISCELEKGGDPLIKQIGFFDLREWKDYHETRDIPQRVDILDLGYWYGDKSLVSWAHYTCNRLSPSYEAPVDDWRELMINLGVAPMPTE
jgi:hypothetical protein